MNNAIIAELIDKSLNHLQGWDERRGNYKESYLDRHKFAELVILECARIVSQTPLSYRDYRSQIEESQRAACVNDLLRYFGIEDEKKPTTI